MSCSRNIDEAHLPSATLVALDMATWAEKGRVRLNAREIYSIVAVPDPDRLVRALGPLSESIVDRLTDVQRDREGLAVRLEQRVADCEAQMQEKDSAWSERVILVAADHVAEIRRIAQERDAMLADKDGVWSYRVEQTALDYQVEIARIASERDAMLVDKYQAWSDRVRQRIVGLFLTLWFFTTPILYPAPSLPSFSSNLQAYNPLGVIIPMNRELVQGERVSNLRSPSIILICSAFPLAVFLYRRVRFELEEFS